MAFRIFLVFFRFPLKDEELLKKWFEVIPYNKNRSITKHSKICSNHFEESQYMYIGNKRVLKEGAIPIFPYVDNVVSKLKTNNILFHKNVASSLLLSFDRKQMKKMKI